MHVSCHEQSWAVTGFLWSREKGGVSRTVSILGTLLHKQEGEERKVRCSWAQCDCPPSSPHIKSVVIPCHSLERGIRMIFPTTTTKIIIPGEKSLSFIAKDLAEINFILQSCREWQLHFFPEHYRILGHMPYISVPSWIGSPSSHWRLGIQRFPFNSLLRWCLPSAQDILLAASCLPLLFCYPLGLFCCLGNLVPYSLRFCRGILIKHIEQSW